MPTDDDAKSVVSSSRLKGGGLDASIVSEGFDDVSLSGSLHMQRGDMAEGLNMTRLLALAQQLSELGIATCFDADV